ncbi:hypothetical protein [Catenuloplanes indicus]|uniref:Uncharacterized protein n=1 Tax=Catenuloplanes indicus TaxID=137267 RepID=A0AAE3W5J8_9ACTN|nr:hypothetical protein [Catenuloplanes indicus]MDQ0368785.1 hypothetical protein [Catenuloplanes indicus]
MRGQPWRIPLWIATATLGAWAADHYVPGFEIDGSLTARLAFGGIVAALTVAAGMAFTVLVLVPFAPLMMLGARIRIVPDPSGDEPLKSETEPHPLVKSISPVLLFILFTAVGAPVSFYLAVQAVRLTGIPVTVTGGWPVYVTAALAMTAVHSSAQALLPAGMWQWATSQLTFLACALVLWFATGQQTLPGLLLLAALLGFLRLTIPERWGAVIQFPADIAALWALAWCSGRLTLPIEFSTPWTLLLTALALTALTLPLRLLPAPSLPAPAPRPGRYRRVGQGQRPRTTTVPIEPERFLDARTLPPGNAAQPRPWGSGGSAPEQK